MVGATVNSRVVFTGSLPNPDRVPVYRDSKFCGESISIDRVQVDRSSRGIEGAVISLEGIEKGKFDHPYFAVTDTTGKYEMPLVPPGSYRIRMWHEALGVRTKTIAVPSSGSLTLDLELNPEE